MGLGSTNRPDTECPRCHHDTAKQWDVYQSLCNGATAQAQRIAELTRALTLARCGLAEGHEAAVRKGKAVHWDILEHRLRTAHDAVNSALET